MPEVEGRHDLCPIPSLQMITDILALYRGNDRKQAGVLDKRDGQGFTMVTVAVFANVITAGGRETLGIAMDRYRVGAVIADHFGGDFVATSFGSRKGIDIGSGFLTWYTRPLALDRRVQLFEFCVSHTDGPGFRIAKSIDAAMIPHGYTVALPECDKSPTHRECCSMT